jgi:hypothetical protein
MADDLTGELVARLKVLHPEYADIPDDVLAASIFHTTNARDAGGAPSVAEALSPWTKAATIGAPGLGERYTRPTYGEVVSSENPARALLNVVGSYLVGAGRPRSVAAADPIGLEAWTQGKGPMPVFIGSTEDVGPSVGAAIRAYHGSPHDFEQFSLSKIGTGEGAQAYGHGLYFAEQEATAKAYRDALKWRGSDWDDPGVIAANVLEKHQGDRQAAIDQLVEANRRNLGFKASEAGNVKREQAIELLKKDLPVGASTNPGRMYEVNIKADPAQFLDWDKPLSEQSPHVQEAIAQMRAAGVLGDETGVATTGAELLRSKSVLAPEHNLQRFGVPGIKYLDEGSRMTGTATKLGDNWFMKGSSTPYPTRDAAERAAKGAGQATHNYVVFDDKLIDVLRKYGLVPPIAGAAALGRAATAPDRAD